jgi:hypothetical protein
VEGIIIDEVNKENGYNGLQIWRVAANILNKQSWTADKEQSSRLGVGHGAKASSL